MLVCSTEGGVTMVRIDLSPSVSLTYVIFWRGRRLPLASTVPAFSWWPLGLLRVVLCEVRSL